jgi:hypothetical protein
MKSKKKYVYERMKNSDWKIKKREKRSGKKDMRGMNQVNEKIKCKDRCHVVEGQNFHSFSNHVQSDNEDVIGAS